MVSPVPADKLGSEHLQQGRVRKHSDGLRAHVWAQGISTWASALRVASQQGAACEQETERV